MTNSISEKFMIPIDVGKDHEMQKEKIPKTYFAVCTSTKKSLPSRQRLSKLVYREGCDVKKDINIFMRFSLFVCVRLHRKLSKTLHILHMCAKKKKLKQK